MTTIAERMKTIHPSATLTISARAQQLKAEGKDIINLGIGESDFDTPNHIKQAAVKALNEGKTKYTPTDGILPLKQAIIAKLQRDNQLHYAPNEIIVSNGAKQCIFDAACALLNPDDEVIIPAPYWVSYPDIVKVMNAKPVIITATMEQHFKITPQQLAQAITKKTKLIIFNSPSNPTGICYSHAELKALGEVLRAHPQVYILSDDIYEKIIWQKESFANIATLCPDLKSRTLVINGVSKAYSMTGWRIGYAAGPAEIIAQMKKAQEQSTSNPCSISQYAAVEALTGDQSCVSEMCAAFKKRHDYLKTRLEKIPAICFLPSDGTFYSFINVASAITQLKLADDLALSEFLLNEAGVAVVPGSAFGGIGYLRLAFTVSDQALASALDRIEKVFKNY